MNINKNKVLVEDVIKNIAHQWRQPLSQINSNVFAIDTILNELNIKDTRIEERLLEIEKLTANLSKTIEDFRTGKKTVFNIKDILDEVHTNLAMVMRDKMISFNVDSKVNFSYTGNRGELLQVIVVIVNNAKDALLERNVHLPQITIETKTEEEFSIIRVKDNAGGMTQKVAEKIFENDYSTKHTSQGTGIGLSMAKSIIQEKFSGDLSVANLDAGSCFEIKIKS